MLCDEPPAGRSEVEPAEVSTFLQIHADKMLQPSQHSTYWVAYSKESIVISCAFSLSPGIGGLHYSESYLLSKTRICYDIHPRKAGSLFFVDPCLINTRWAHLIRKSSQPVKKEEGLAGLSKGAKVTDDTFVTGTL